MRNLKLKARLIKGGNCEITILEQSHFAHKFGGMQILRDDPNTMHSFIRGGIALVSYYEPRYSVSYTYINNWFGHIDTPDGIEVDCIVFLHYTEFSGTITMHRSYWPRIKKEVEAYNEFYKNK